METLSHSEPEKKFEETKFRFDIKTIISMITLISTLVGFGVLLGLYVNKLDKIDKIEARFNSFTEDYLLIVGELKGKGILASVNLKLSPDFDDLYTNNFDSLSLTLMSSENEIEDINLNLDYLTNHINDANKEFINNLIKKISNEQGSINPQEIYLFLGISYLKMDQPLRAIEVFKKTPKENPFYQSILWYKLLAYLKLGDIFNMEKTHAEIEGGHSIYKERAQKLVRQTKKVINQRD